MFLIEFFKNYFKHFALKKELISEDINAAMELFFHGLKFYLKLLSNQYVIMDSIRGFEAPFVKADLLEHFYTRMFAFLKQALDKPIETKKGITSKTEYSKYGYLFKIYVSIFLQFVVCCFNYQLKKGYKI